MPLPATPTISGLLTAYMTGRCDPLQLARDVHARVAASGARDAFIALVDEGRLLNRAHALKEALAADRGVLDRMPLFGIPFAVKDNIDVAGMATTCACPAYAHTVAESATVVERLEAAGALLVGKTNLDQFATGLVGTRTPYGKVCNPFAPDYISGGSSSGSAVAVAKGLVAFALGTDTAGSGRVPAGFCNLVGIKPTPGLVSTRGVVPACRSLDCVSVMAHTVEDAWTVLAQMAAFDPACAYSREVTPLPLTTRDVRFGVTDPLEFFGDAAARQAFADSLEIIRAIDTCTVRTVPFAPFGDVARMLYEGAWVAERRAAVGAFFDTNAADMDPTVRTIIGSADGRTAIDAFAGFYRLEAARQMVRDVFRDIDVLIVPTAPTIYTHTDIAADPIRLNSNLGVYTNFVNLLGMCALALPGPFRSDGLPAGITLIAPGGGDHRLAAIAQRLESFLHQRLGTTQAEPPRAEALVSPLPSTEPMVSVAVVGAHLSGMPLNWQLVERGGRLLRTTRTSPQYRLFALSDTDIPKPGLLRVPTGGVSIELEVWQLPERCFGSFVAGIPAPLGIGTLELEDGTAVQGFICESAALADADDISHYGGWRAFRAAVSHSTFDSPSQGVQP